MKIFNETKTKELNGKEIDIALGYLKEDRLLVEHHEAEPFKQGCKAAEIAEAYITEGKTVENINGKYYEVTTVFKNGGKSVKEIKDEPDTPAKEAWDEYEDILVYIPYTPDELAERKINALRTQRQIECFSIINRGELWYETLTAEQRAELKSWYNAWLNVTGTLEVPEKPNWLN